MGDIVVRSAKLHGTIIAGDLIPRLVDEIPVLAVAAACADGVTEIHDAQELKVKESNRLETINQRIHSVASLRRLTHPAEIGNHGLLVGDGHISALCRRSGRAD